MALIIPMGRATLKSPGRLIRSLRTRRRLNRAATEAPGLPGPGAGRAEPRGLSPGASTCSGLERRIVLAPELTVWCRTLRPLGFEGMDAGQRCDGAGKSPSLPWPFPSMPILPGRTVREQAPRGQFAALAPVSASPGLGTSGAACLPTRGRYAISRQRHRLSLPGAANGTAQRRLWGRNPATA